MLSRITRLNRIRMAMANGALPINSSDEKVAFDLMQVIAGLETGKAAEKSKEPRKYYLELYAQCLRIVSGEDFEDVLEDIE